METSVTQPITRRAPLSALTKLTIAALIAFAGILVFAQAFLGGQFSFEQTILAVVLLLGAGVITTGWRWAPLLGALLCAAIMGGGVEVIINDLRHPEAFRFFAAVLFSVVVTLTGMAARRVRCVCRARDPLRRRCQLDVRATCRWCAGCATSAHARWKATSPHRGVVHGVRQRQGLPVCGV